MTEQCGAVGRTVGLRSGNLVGFLDPFKFVKEVEQIVEIVEIRRHQVTCQEAASAGLGMKHRIGPSIPGL